MRIRVPDSPLSSPDVTPPSSPVVSQSTVSPTAKQRPSNTPLQKPGSGGKRPSRDSIPSSSSGRRQNSLNGSGGSSSNNAPIVLSPPPRVASWEHQEFYAAVKLRQRRDPLEEYDERERQIAWQEAQERSERMWKPIADLLKLDQGTRNLGPSTSLSQSLPLSLVTPSLDERIQNAREAQLREVGDILSRLEINEGNAKKKRVELETKQKNEMWDSINRAIQVEEAAARKLAEEKEAARRAEEDRLRKIEEERQRKIREAEEAKKRADEAEAKREAERKAAAEAEEARRKEAEAKEKAQLAAAAKEAEESKHSPPTARQEFQKYWDLLQTFKAEVMPVVRPRKGDSSRINPEWRKVWSATRRSFTPKIGQVTNSMAEINRIANLIQVSLAPTPAYPQQLYAALLSSLAKAFLLQAETEVTAKPSTAYPLARLILKITEMHPVFPDVFLARLLGRTGGWALGTTIPKREGQSDDDYRKTLGYAPNESSSQYIDRVVGMITLYFAILQTSVADPSSISLQRLSTPHGIPFLFPRIWSWLARVVSNPVLVGDRAAAQLIYAVVEVAGDMVLGVYGKQVVKWRRTLGRVCMDEGPGGEMVGGSEGKAARVRLGLLLEKWEREGKVGGEGREVGP